MTLHYSLRSKCNTVSKNRRQRILGDLHFNQLDGMKKSEKNEFPILVQAAWLVEQKTADSAAPTDGRLVPNVNGADEGKARFSVTADSCLVNRNAIVSKIA